MSESGISSLFVAGAGLMGSGIAHTAAQSGVRVALYDAAEGAAERAIGRIGDRLARAEQSGQLAAGAAANTVENLRAVADPGAAADTQMVIEAISEQLEVKLAFWSTMDQICPDPVLFASNTSSIPITRLAATTTRPEQFIGMHFYSPVPVMELVELVRGLLTSDATYATVERLSRDLGKSPVSSADTPGFIGNRILIPFLNEAMQALQEGVGSAKDIDQVAKLGFRHPMGPLELADFIGLDVILGICKVMYEGLHDSRYAPNPILERMVEAGHLGRKSGRGFHNYSG
ncbi:MAG: 3-hydroxybutyryl-CoA dehydrogenase [Candidatus Dormibacteraeota bacterium]|nr:3-hydroxybutyryl-CoA dehydrogenase [Candidatus Dormibacteraeota bacterium]